MAGPKKGRTTKGKTQPRKAAGKATKPVRPAHNTAPAFTRAPEADRPHVPSAGVCRRSLDEQKWPPRHDGIRCHGYHVTLPMPQREAMHKPVPEVTDANQAAFLECLAYTGNVSQSCRLAGVGRRTVYDWRAKDEEFEKAFVEALECYADVVDEEMHARGIEGWDEPQFGRIDQFSEGLIGFVRKKSDAVLLKLASGVRPEKYGKQLHDVRGKDGAPLHGDLSGLSEEELLLYRGLVAKISGKEKG